MPVVTVECLAVDSGLERRHWQSRQHSKLAVEIVTEPGQKFTHLRQIEIK
jgi:hypothetical protein